MVALTPEGTPVPEIDDVTILHLTEGNFPDLIELANQYIEWRRIENVIKTLTNDRIGYEDAIAHTPMVYEVYGQKIDEIDALIAMNRELQNHCQTLIDDIKNVNKMRAEEWENMIRSGING